MKIVFSFDDGLLNFYKNAFPILKKYHIKATLNVVTGFSEKTISNNNLYCSVDQIKEMSNYGIEIAAHSHSHTNPITISDLDICFSKLKRWDQTISGLVLPYNQQISKDIIIFCKKNNIKYIRTKLFYKKSPKTLVYKLLKKLHLINNYKQICLLAYLTSTCKKIKIIPSVEILKRNDPNYYFNIIKNCKPNKTITFMFHSILNDKEHDKEYENGSWSCKNFEKLIQYCLENNIEITTQLESL